MLLWCDLFVICCVFLLLRYEQGFCAMSSLCFVGANAGSSSCVEARLLTCHTEPSLGSSPLTRTLRYARRFDGMGGPGCSIGLGEGHPEPIASKNDVPTHRAILQDAVEYHWHPGGLATEGCSACIVELGPWSTYIPNVGIQILAASHTRTVYILTRIDFTVYLENFGNK